MRTLHLRSLVLAPVLAVAATLPAAALDPEGFDLGLRGNILTGDGEPTNDVLGYGLFGHVPLGEKWSIGFALDHSPEFDVERTAQILGIPQSRQDEEIDSIGSSTTLSAWLERRYGDRFQWLWGIGAGVADVDVDPLEGTRPNGNPFRIETDAGTELLLIGNAGFRYWFGEAWAVSTELRLEQHFGSWELLDVPSRATGEIDDYLLTGISFGVSRRF